MCHLMSCAPRPARVFAQSCWCADVGLELKHIQVLVLVLPHSSMEQVESRISDIVDMIDVSYEPT